jgi:hypothetical protein
VNPSTALTRGAQKKELEGGGTITDLLADKVLTKAPDPARFLKKYFI